MLLRSLCNSLHSSVISFIIKHSERTERAAESSFYASLQEGKAVNYMCVTLSDLQEKNTDRDFEDKRKITK